jgi:hypothetical protein
MNSTKIKKPLKKKNKAEKRWLFEEVINNYGFAVEFLPHRSI